MSRTRNRYNDYVKISERIDIYNIERKYKAAIYVRVSVDNKDSSVSNQIEMCKEYIMNNNEISLVEIYVDNGVSGKDFCRKGYRKLVDDINIGRINCIIVKDISRLGRNFIEISKILEYEMVIKNVRIIAINDNYDSKMDKELENRFCYNSSALKNIILRNMINEIYIKDTSYKIRKSKEYLRERGAYIGVYCPYGYKIQKKNGIRKLEIDEKTYKIVEKIRKLYEENRSYTYVSQWLYSQNINTKTDYRKQKKVYAENISELKKWSVKSIKETIENEYSYLL